MTIRTLFLAAAAGVILASPALAQTAYMEVVQAAPAPVEDLAVQLERLRARNAQLEQALENHRALLAQARAEATLKDELIVLGRERNAELYATAREILDRYGDLDFRDVMSRREPFVQASRVRLENLVQDYEDRLRAARVYETTLPPSVEARMQSEIDGAASAQAAPAAATAQ